MKSNTIFCHTTFCADTMRRSPGCRPGPRKSDGSVPDFSPSFASEPRREQKLRIGSRARNK